LLGVGIVLVALMKYFSGAEDVGKGFAKVLGNITQGAKTLGGLFQAAFSDDLVGRSLKTVTKQFLKAHDLYSEANTELLAMQDDKGKRLVGVDEADYKTQLDKVNTLAQKKMELNKLVGKSGQSGLEFMSNKEMESSAVSLAHFVDSLKNLAQGFKYIAEGAIIPIMWGMMGVVTALKVVFKAVLSPFLVLAALFGLASDEASAFAFILKAVGFAIGVLISGFLMFKSISLMLGAIKGLGLGFLNLKQKIKDNIATNKKLTNAYKNGVVETNRYRIGLGGTQAQLKQATAGQKVQIGVLGKLKLRYLALTGQMKDYKAGIKQMTAQQKRATADANQLKNAFSAVSRAAMGLSSIAFIGGEIAAAQGFEKTSKALYAFGTAVIVVVPGAIALFTALGTAVTLISWPMALIAVAVLGLTWALGGFSSAVEDLPSGDIAINKKVDQELNVSSPSIGGESMVASTPHNFTSNGIGSSPMGTYGSTRTNIEKQIGQNFIINGGLTINTDNPEELGNQIVYNTKIG